MAMTWKQFAEWEIKGLDWHWRDLGWGYHPDIWARKTTPGWECQFAYGAHGLVASGRTRGEATDKLMRMFRDLKEHTT